MDKFETLTGIAAPMPLVPITLVGGWLVDRISPIAIAAAMSIFQMRLMMRPTPVIHSWKWPTMRGGESEKFSARWRKSPRNSATMNLERKNSTSANWYLGTCCFETLELRGFWCSGFIAMVCLIQLAFIVKHAMARSLVFKI